MDVSELLRLCEDVPKREGVEYAQASQCNDQDEVEEAS